MIKEFFDIFFRNWVWFVVLGNFLVAVSYIISKVLVSGSVSKPLNPTPYTFYSGLGGPVIVVALSIANIWFNFFRIDFWLIACGISAGLFIILGLWPLYLALSRNEASCVMTLYVGAIPIFTFIIKYLFLSERLTDIRLLAFVLLVMGGILVSLKQYKRKNFVFKDIIITGTSALSEAIGLVLLEAASKMSVFPGEQWKGFFSAFSWVCTGYFLASLVVYFWPGQRKKIVNSSDYATKFNLKWFLTEKGIGMSGSILPKLAISFAGATLVNAFEGLKQFFVLVLAGIISIWKPSILKEELKGVVLWQKIIAAALVFSGIFLLIYNKG
jgi:hypothetical protein